MKVNIPVKLKIEFRGLKVH